MKFFEGCVALVTGASSGLGAEFARQLAPFAKILVLVARRQDRLEALRNELLVQYPGCSVHAYRADLSQKEEREALANWLHKEEISLNFLVNNAGLGDYGEFSKADWSRINFILEVNIIALTHLTYLLLPSLLRQAPRAAVLNVSSVASFFPLPNTAIYSATKSYVTSFSEALAMELRSQGITVTALCPGPVPTEFSQVATRPEQKPLRHSDLMPAFVVTPRQAVESGLQAVATKRPRIIPGSFLSVAVNTALLIPFCLTRKVISYFRTSL